MVCGYSLSGEDITCAHCGHIHSEEDIEKADRGLRKKELLSAICGLIFFPALFYVAIRFLNGA